MNEIVLSPEQYEILKNQILSDIKLENSKKWKKELIAVERKYHRQLVSINGGST